MWHLKWGISRFRGKINTVLRLYSTFCRIGLGKSCTGVTNLATSSVQSHIKVWIVEIPESIQCDQPAKKVENDSCWMEVYIEIPRSLLCLYIEIAGCRACSHSGGTEHS